MNPGKPQIQVYGSVDMVTHMKTTIELPDELARHAKRVAREANTTLRELIETGLRAEIDRRAKQPKPPEFRFRTVSGAGLRPGIEPADLREHAYEHRP